MSTENAFGRAVITYTTCLLRQDILHKVPLCKYTHVPLAEIQSILNRLQANNPGLDLSAEFSVSLKAEQPKT